MTLLDPLAWAIVFMLCGCALVVLEVFLPSGGMISFFAALCFVGSIWMAFRADLSTGLGFIMISLVAVPTVVALAFKYWPMTPMGKAFLGELPDEEETRYVDPRRDLVGKRGVTKSKMLPSGAVSIDGKLIDAVAQGGGLDLGEDIVVVEVRGNRVMVRAANTEAARRAAEARGDLLSQPLEDFGLESIDETASLDPPRP